MSIHRVFFVLLFSCLLWKTSVSAQNIEDLIKQHQDKRITEEQKILIHKKLYKQLSKDKKNGKKVSLATKGGKLHRGKVARLAKTKVMLENYKGQKPVVKYSQITGKSFAKYLANDYPKDGEFQFALALMLVEEKEIDWAERCLKNAVKQGHPKAQEYYLLAQHYFKLLRDKEESTVNEKESSSPERSAEKIKGDGPAIVFVAIDKIDSRILTGLKKNIQEALRIPTYIEEIPYSKPGPKRNALTVFLTELRGGIENVPAAKGQDLSSDKNLIRFYRRLLKSSAEGRAQMEAFDATIKQLGKQQGQWEVREVLSSFGKAVKPYSREGVSFVGITNSDLFTGRYPYLAGLSSPYDRTSVVSTYRFAGQQNNEAPNRNRLQKRIAVVVFSHLSGIYKIESCQDPKCSCSTPNNMKEYDQRRAKICKVCRQGFVDKFKEMESEKK